METLKTPVEIKAAVLAPFFFAFAWAMSEVGVLLALIVVIMLLPFAIKSYRYLSRLYWLTWAGRQVRPIIISQTSPDDFLAHKRADEIRRLLVDSGNENLVDRGANGRVQKIRVYEVYYQDEPYIRETWEEYRIRVEQIQIQEWNKRLREYKEANTLWAIEQWHRQKDVTPGPPPIVRNIPK